MDIIKWIKNPETNKIYKWNPIPGKLKIVCCLPYVLGFASHEGKISCTRMDLRKPILIMAMSKDCFSHLEENLSAQPTDRGKPFLQDLEFIFEIQAKQGAHYTVHVTRDVQGARRATKAIGKVDIVLSSFEYCSSLPDGCFSIVFVYGDHQLSHDQQLMIQDKFTRHSLVLLFTSRSLDSKMVADGESEEVMEASGDQLGQGRKYHDKALPKLVKYSHIVNANRIQAFLTKSQLNVLNEVVLQITDTHGSNVPVVVSTDGGEGDIAMLCCLPYFLGQSSPFLPEMDLNKPILILAPDAQSLDLLKMNFKVKPLLLSYGYMSRREAVEGFLYDTYAVEDGYDAATISRLINQHEIVLAPATLYQSFPKDSFSVVVVFESNNLRPVVETNIIRTFRGAKMIFFKVGTGKAAMNVVTRMDPRVTSLLQAFGDLKLLPRVIRHGRHMKDTYFFNKDSLLTKPQQMGLNILIDWFVYSNNKNESVVVDSVIGFEQTAKMICCLPYMYGWAVATGLINETQMDLRFPILVLGKKETVKRLWKLIHGKPFYVPSDHRFSFETYTDSLYRSYLVRDATSARIIRQIIGKDDVAVSDLNYLEDLPHDSFSVVIVYNIGPLQESLMNSTLKKFGTHSKITFINAHIKTEEIKRVPSDEHFSLHTLMKYGEQMRNEHLLGEDSKLSIYEQAVLSAAIEWMAHPETRNLPLTVEAGTNFMNIDKVLSILPYMLGWAVQSKILPASEMALQTKSILVLASEATVMERLKTIFFYPFLVKCGLLSPELVLEGAYYTAKVLRDHDVLQASSLVDQYSILICDLKHYMQFPCHFAAATFVISPGSLKPAVQKRICERFVSFTKVIFVKMLRVDQLVMHSEADSWQQSSTVLNDQTSCSRESDADKPITLSSESLELRRTSLHIKSWPLPDDVFPLEKPRRYKKMAATELPMDHPLHKTSTATQEEPFDHSTEDKKLMATTELPADQPLRANATAEETLLHATSAEDKTFIGTLMDSVLALYKLHNHHPLSSSATQVETVSESKQYGSGSVSKKESRAEREYHSNQYRSGPVSKEESKVEREYGYKLHRHHPLSSSATQVETVSESKQYGSGPVSKEESKVEKEYGYKLHRRHPLSSSATQVETVSESKQYGSGPVSKEESKVEKEYGYKLHRRHPLSSSATQVETVSESKQYGSGPVSKEESKVGREYGYKLHRHHPLSSSATQVETVSESKQYGSGPVSKEESKVGREYDSKQYGSGPVSKEESRVKSDKQYGSGPVSKEESRVKSDKHYESGPVSKEESRVESDKQYGSGPVSKEESRVKSDKQYGSGPVSKEESRVKSDKQYESGPVSKEESRVESDKQDGSGPVSKEESRVKSDKQYGSGPVSKEESRVKSDKQYESGPVSKEESRVESDKQDGSGPVSKEESRVKSDKQDGSGPVTKKESKGKETSSTNDALKKDYLKADAENTIKVVCPSNLRQTSSTQTEGFRVTDTACQALEDVPSNEGFKLINTACQALEDVPSNEGFKLINTACQALEDVPSNEGFKLINTACQALEDVPLDEFKITDTACQALEDVPSNEGFKLSNTTCQALEDVPLDEFKITDTACQALEDVPSNEGFKLSNTTCQALEDVPLDEFKITATACQALEDIPQIVAEGASKDKDIISMKDVSQPVAEGDSQEKEVVSVEVIPQAVSKGEGRDKEIISVEGIASEMAGKSDVMLVAHSNESDKIPLVEGMDGSVYSLVLGQKMTMNELLDQMLALPKEEKIKRPLRKKKQMKHIRERKSLKRRLYKIFVPKLIRVTLKKLRRMIKRSKNGKVHTANEQTSAQKEGKRSERVHSKLEEVQSDVNVKPSNITQQSKRKKKVPASTESIKKRKGESLSDSQAVIQKKVTISKYNQEIPTNAGSDTDSSRTKRLLKRSRSQTKKQKPHPMILALKTVKSVEHRRKDVIQDRVAEKQSCGSLELQKENESDVLPSPIHLQSNVENFERDGTRCDSDHGGSRQKKESESDVLPSPTHLQSDLENFERKGTRRDSEYGGSGQNQVIPTSTGNDTDSFEMQQLHKRSISQTEAKVPHPMSLALKTVKSAEHHRKDVIQDQVAENQSGDPSELQKERESDVLPSPTRLQRDSENLEEDGTRCDSGHVCSQEIQQSAPESVLIVTH